MLHYKRTVNQCFDISQLCTTFLSQFENDINDFNVQYIPLQLLETKWPCTPYIILKSGLVIVKIR